MIRTKQKNKSELLTEKIVDLESKLKKMEEDLKISQKRYEIALSFSDVTIFDYNIETKKILTQPSDFEDFGMPGMLEGGVEEVIQSGIILERSKKDIRELYQKIDNGAVEASAIIYASDSQGKERTLELKMVAIFDENGKPISAVGVRKDITESVWFQKEKEYSALLNSEFNFIYEANVTRNKLLRCDTTWGKEVGADKFTTISELLQMLVNRYIALVDTKIFLEKQERDYILNEFENGKRIIDFEYRKWAGDLGYQWFEARINLIEDEYTKEINMRVYTSNIDKKKKKEIEAVAEQQRYKMATSKATIIYEVNITKDQINWGKDVLKEKYNIVPKKNFSETMIPVILKTIHPEDKEAIATLLSYKNLKKAYNKGKKECVCEYRQRGKLRRYHWFRCSIQLFKEQSTNDLLGYVKIEDINTEKEKERILIYKGQHDLMTGFYNKNAVAEEIDKFLGSKEGKDKKHSFFIVDLDYFKIVNDRFGHAFGDMVLSETASEIDRLFRKEDILGRIGGDEFVVFMKNVQNEEIIRLKAQEICDKVSKIYVQNNIEFKVTISVGVAIYSSHGINFDQLYRHSDIALYDVKARGRNGFSIYNEEMKA
ncbi:MAG: sensor domain-containing diguanylate cyclase [Eubacterium sp.]